MRLKVTVRNIRAVFLVLFVSLGIHAYVTIRVYLADSALGGLQIFSLVAVCVSFASAAFLLSFVLSLWERRPLKQSEEKLSEAYDALKNTQTQLLQSAKMVSVGLLAGGVAHEINNPLTGVINNVQLMRMMAEKKENFAYAEFKDIIDSIEESALRCSKITRSLLDFSRISTGEFKEFSLNEVIERVVELIEHEFQLQNIAIHKKLEVSLGYVFGDAQLLKQVIFDVIANARWAIKKKAGKDGGVIVITTEPVLGKNGVLLSIKDTGVGIPKENVERIFEPFFTTKTIGEGTGLGLSIVYTIIKEHKGSIDVVSGTQKGTTVRIFLPVSSQGAK